MKIEFVPLVERHVGLLASWLQQPHVKEFWQETEDVEKLREKYLGLTEMRGVLPYIVVIDGIESAYVQSYEACKVGGGWWPDAKPGTFGVDQFIGIATMIGRGIGTEFLKLFTRRLFEVGAVEIITDPDPSNLRAIRAYEKVGFVRVGEITTPGGPALLMKMTRENFENE